MDYLSLEPDRSNIKDILVITDHFTRYAVAIPTRNQKAQTVAKSLWDNFFVHYGFPEKLLSDQGPDFESKLIKELCRMAGIHKVRTTPYHPRGNPVERFNRTLLQMLGTLDDKGKTRWKDFVKPLVHAYNCTRNDSTGFSPYELMFGRQPRLPIDLAFNLPADESIPSHSSYVRNLKECLEESYRVASENASKVAGRNKKRFDERVVASFLEVGDRVLVRNVKLRGKHKLADKWDKEVYIVVKKAVDLPVYTVQPEGRDGPLRTLHRDLLLPCGFLGKNTPEKPEKQKHLRPRTRANPRTEESECMSENSDSEEDSTSYYTPVRLPSVENRILYNSRPQKQSSGGVSIEVCPVKKTKMNTDPEQPTPVTSKMNLPDTSNAEEESLLDEPDREDTEMIDLVRTDVSNHLPVGEDPGLVEQRKELDELASKMSSKDDRTDILPQDDVIDQRNARSAQTEVDQIEGGVPRRSQRCHEPPKRLQYPQLGNPLSLVIQSLMQGLSTAFVTSLGESDSLERTSG
ncbi:uncharacterized protein LOC122340940 [Puntigrus tetrazona]|uniref:uncharacterized protein LOC122340940 n=1 Tax=Puntigrus tetrazona TaxID=1606681 RepID=UPI001C891EFF|nr:uncharacterized protein LOC122340940 [Puntigrus tetrazona]